MKNPVVAALAAVNLALALGLAALWLKPSGEPRNVHWTPPQPIQPDYLQMLPALREPGVVRTDEFLQLLERPLFSSSRRPPPPPPPPTPPPPPDLLANAQLVGTYNSGGGAGVIVQMDGKSRRIRLGEALNGWQLKTIQERVAIFTNGEQSRELPLIRAKIGSAVADPAPAAASAAPVTFAVPVIAAQPDAAPAATPESAANANPVATPRKRRFGP